MFHRKVESYIRGWPLLKDASRASNTLTSLANNTPRQKVIQKQKTFTEGAEIQGEQGYIYRVIRAASRRSRNVRCARSGRLSGSVSQRHQLPASSASSQGIILQLTLGYKAKAAAMTRLCSGAVGGHVLVGRRHGGGSLGMCEPAWRTCRLVLSSDGPRHELPDSPSL